MPYLTIVILENWPNVYRMPYRLGGDLSFDQIPHSIYCLWLLMLSNIDEDTTDELAVTSGRFRTFFNTFHSDFVAGMEALAMDFPSLARLDLDFHSFELITTSAETPKTELLRRSLRVLNASPAINSLQIRLQWKTELYDETLMNVLGWRFKDITTYEQWEEWARGVQNELFKIVRMEVRAKEVTVDESTQRLEKYDARKYYKT